MIILKVAVGLGRIQKSLLLHTLTQKAPCHASLTLPSYPLLFWHSLLKISPEKFIRVLWYLEEHKTEHLMWANEARHLCYFPIFRVKSRQVDTMTEVCAIFIICHAYPVWNIFFELWASYTTFLSSEYTSG